MADLLYRLCQINEADGGQPGAGAHPDDPDFDLGTKHIPVSLFIAGLKLLRDTLKTQVEVESAFNMDATQQAEFDVFIGWMTSGGATKDTIDRRIEQFELAMFLYEQRGDYPFLSQWDTPTKLQNWFSNNISSVT